MHDGAFLRLSLHQELHEITSIDLIMVRLLHALPVLSAMALLSSSVVLATAKSYTYDTLLFLVGKDCANLGSLDGLTIFGPTETRSPRFSSTMLSRASLRQKTLQTFLIKGQKSKHFKVRKSPSTTKNSPSTVLTLLIPMPLRMALSSMVSMVYSSLLMAEAASPRATHHPRARWQEV